MGFRVCSGEGMDYRDHIMGSKMGSKEVIRTHP